MTEIVDLLSTTPLAALISIGTLVLVVWGIAPGLVLRLASLCFEKEDPKRREMIAELYVVPRWDQPLWVAQQVERSLMDGLGGRVIDAGRGRLWDRWEYMDGIAMNAMAPDTFEIPEQRHKDQIRVGDLVKVGFDSFREGGERMWVEVTKVKGDRYWGTLANQPAVVWGVHYGSRLRFRGKHIISLYEDEQFERANLAPAAGLSR
ncbi:hypothetical protein ACFSBZ_16205 [Amnibacterium flavum]|uniref:DUF2314 domain-containing protein n=1 Tax=Amnibacterium flavum TaxID=2173173 RepID=A0A2V1HSK0_9MICO|nr:hypothetical protein [Amnibacterium flavum]PVZ93297.1 hypothetical protein DDQ50_16525 [Amnibacterium flavum]